MTTKSKLCIVTDFSPESLNTIRYGIKLAKKIGFDMHFTHAIVPQYSPYGGMDSMSVRYEEVVTKTGIEEAKKQLESMVEELSQEYRDMPETGYSVRTGTLEQVVVEVTEQENIKMLLLTGQKQKSKLAWLLSDVLTPVIKSISIPVMVIPHDFSYNPVKKIVYATDYQEEDLRSLKALSVWAKALSAGITAVHITDDQDFRDKLEKEGFEKLVSNQAGLKDLSIQVIKAGEVEKGLMNFVEENGGDIIAMLKENEGFWKSLLTKGETSKVIFEAQRPVIVFHQGSEKPGK